MHWQDEGFILASRPQGERNAIVEIMTAQHGRHFGLVRGGRAPAMHALLQAGNFVRADWQARLEEHLGTFRLELLKPYAIELMHERQLLYVWQIITMHLRLLPEREQHRRLYRFIHILLKYRADVFVLLQLLVRFEILYLKEIGFGLNLRACAVTKTHQNLCYVSPKSGNAVSSEIGRPWKDKLLPLPPFLTSLAKGAHDIAEIKQGFALTGYFLERNLFDSRYKVLFCERQVFLSKLLNSL